VVKSGQLKTRIYDGRLPKEDALDDGKPASAPGTGADISGGRQAHPDFLKQRLEVNSDMTREDRFSLAPRSLAAMTDWMLASQTHEQTK
jgi:hypothetical protein